MLLIELDTDDPSWSWAGCSCCGHMSEGFQDYTLGKYPAHYPVPALASSGMCLMLSHIVGVQQCDTLAWDGIWRDDVVFCALFG